MFEHSTKEHRSKIESIKPSGTDWIQELIRTGQGRPGFWVDGHALWDAKAVVKYSFMNEDAWIPQARFTRGGLHVSQPTANDFLDRS